MTTTAPQDAIATLSERELDVYRLYGSAWSNHEIAKELFLSVKTVATHLANIRNKLGRPNRHVMMRDAVLWVEGRKA